MKISVAGIIFMTVAAPATAHDFWIQTSRFNVATGAPVPLDFLVGHGKARERWNNPGRILMMSDHFNARGTDLRANLQRGGPNDLTARFTTPGLHVVAMQSNHAFSELPAVRFNDYLKEEGLARISATRLRDRTTGKAGRERYSRRAKALIQVGRATPANQAQVTRPIGLTLEIVPERNPYFLDRSRVLPLHVLYNGKRLPNATVKLFNLSADDRPLAVAVTDSSGRVGFRVPPTGDWLVNVVWGEPVKGDPKADFATVFSSLTFGYSR